jgi:hypothetical protein
MFDAIERLAEKAKIAGGIEEQHPSGVKTPADIEHLRRG